MRFRTCLPVAALMLAGIAHCEVVYTLTPDTANNQLNVAVTIPVTSESLSVQIPNWAPGSYRYANYPNNIKNVMAIDQDSVVIEPTHPDANTWTISAKGKKKITFSYSVPARFTRENSHYSGPATYVYVVGRKTEKCRLEMKLPVGWKTACGLDEGKSENSYAAPDYDVLADNPMTYGKFESDTYTVMGVPHTIAYHTGDPSQTNRAEVLRYCKYVSESEGTFFGGLPFKKYIWHFNVTGGTDGGSGLEHLSSTEISMAAGLGKGTVSVFSHEYFHAWNVKRIRSEPLGPFDYLVMPKTGALWWLEGVTDYYADVLLHRYGMFDTDWFHSTLTSNVTRTRSNPERMNISPYDSSYRVSEADNGRGNSNGLLVSYYNTGWLVGLCLDIELRARTGGKKSTDDVMRDLFRECKNNQPGFKEDRIRQLLIKHGGAEMGPIYDTWVMKPGELPVEAQLAKVGLQMGNMDEQIVDLGVVTFPNINGGLRIARISAFATDKLDSEDIIIGVNGVDLSTMTGGGAGRAFRTATEKVKAGDVYKLKVKRGDKELDVEITAGSSTRKTFKVTEDPKATEEQKALRAKFYFADAKKIVVK